MADIPLNLATKNPTC